MNSEVLFTGAIANKIWRFTVWLNHFPNVWKFKWSAWFFLPETVYIIMSICRFFISVVWQQWAKLYKNLRKDVEFSEQKIFFLHINVVLWWSSSAPQPVCGLTNIRRGSQAETRSGSSAASNQLVCSLGVSGVSSVSSVSSLNTGVNLSYSVSTAPQPHSLLTLHSAAQLSLLLTCSSAVRGKDVSCSRPENQDWP